jgi:chorismate dehydratase
MRPVRLGAVGYLNARPLVYGLDADPRFTLRYDVPSRCATLLHAGEIDLGMIPSIELAAGNYRIVSGVAIASEGPVGSVALFSRKPIERIESIALDESSRTSVALLRVLCAERFGIAPAFRAARPDLEGMLAKSDAALLIGDPALFARHDALGVLKVDLGEEWTAATGLPFVWAFWAGRAGAASPETCEGLEQARDAGVDAIPAVAAEFAQGDVGRERIARRYLRENIKYFLGERQERGLERFFGSAARLGLVGRPVAASFYGAR